jgi:hypothetical protein
MPVGKTAERDTCSAPPIQRNRANPPPASHSTGTRETPARRTGAGRPRAQTRGLHAERLEVIVHDLVEHTPCGIAWCLARGEPDHWLPQWRAACQRETRRNRPESEGRLRSGGSFSGRECPIDGRFGRRVKDGRSQPRPVHGSSAPLKSTIRIWPRWAHGRNTRYDDPEKSACRRDVYRKPVIPRGRTRVTRRLGSRPRQDLFLGPPP